MGQRWRMLCCGRWVAVQAGLPDSTAQLCMLTGSRQLWRRAALVFTAAHRAPAVSPLPSTSLPSRST